MAKTTRATQFLDKAGVAYTTVTYDYDPNAERIGLQAAEAIGEHPGQRRPHHHAEKTRTGEQAGLCTAQAELGFDRAEQEGHHRQIHGVEEKRQGDDDKDDSNATINVSL